MSFPTDPLHSKGWFDNCLQTEDGPMPADLRQLSESLCRRFDIRGICDPMYIANVAAYELGRGDGRGAFHEPDLQARESQGQRIERFAERMLFAYSSCVKGGRDELLSLARQALA